MPEFADVQSITVGDAKITYLADGGGRMVPTAAFPASSDADWERYTEYLDDEGRFVTSIGGWLVQLGRATVVVDTGIGPV